MHLFIPLEGGREYALNLGLFAKVVVAECSHSVAPSKVELKLKKAVNGKWDSLEGSGAGEITQAMGELPEEPKPSKQVGTSPRRPTDAQLPAN